MYAVQFETNANNHLIEIPKQFKNLFSKHMKVIVMIDDEAVERQTYDFSDLEGRLQWRGDALSEQRRLRDEW